MTTKLDKLLQKEAQLKAQIQLAQAAERTLERKRDTRRKILIGAAVMARIDSERWPKADLLEMMDGFLSRPNERDLFELDEVSEAADALAQSDAQPKQKQMVAATKATAKRDQTVQPSQAKKQRSRKLPVNTLDVEKEFNL